jgi:hypothetical protein
MWRRLLGTSLLLPLLAGCSSFHREWRAAANLAVPAGDISGCWEGTWQNSNNTHQDKMRAILTGVGASEYAARFHAKYKKSSASAIRQPSTANGSETSLYSKARRIWASLPVAFTNTPVASRPRISFRPTTADTTRARTR